jgi:hypothetical protein
MEKLADWNLERVTKMWGVVSPVIEAKYLKDVKRKNEAGWPSGIFWPQMQRHSAAVGTREGRDSLIP